MVKDSNIRAAVWAKYTDCPDKVDNLCFCCHSSMISAFNFHLSHVIASRYGGPDTVVNLRPCCAPCNVVSGARNLLQYRREKFGLQVCLYPDCYYEAVCGRFCLQHEDEGDNPVWQLSSAMTSLSLSSTPTTTSTTSTTATVAAATPTVASIASLRNAKMKTMAQQKLSVMIDDIGITNYIMGHGEVLSGSPTSLNLSSPSTPSTPSSANPIRSTTTTASVTKKVNFKAMSVDNFFFPKPSAKLKWDFDTYEKFQQQITSGVSRVCKQYTDILEVLMRYYLLELNYLLLPHSSDSDYMVFCVGLTSDDNPTAELCLLHADTAVDSKDYLHHLCSHYQLLETKDSYKRNQTSGKRALTKTNLAKLMTDFVKDCQVYDSNSTFTVYQVDYVQTEDDEGDQEDEDNSDSDSDSDYQDE